MAASLAFRSVSSIFFFRSATPLYAWRTVASLTR
jgi:hypothetical protein